MVFGGRTLLHSDYDATLDLEALNKALVIYLKMKDAKNFDRSIKRFCDRLGLHMLNGIPRIEVNDFEESVSTTINILMVDVRDSSKRLTYHFNHTDAAVLVNDKPKKSYGKIENTKVKERELIRGIDFDMITATCPVARDFQKGIDIHHDATFWLATQVVHLYGGESWFYEGLRKRKVYDENKWRYTLSYIKQKGYSPMGYDKISAYYGNVEKEIGFKNLVILAKHEREDLS